MKTFFSIVCILALCGCVSVKHLASGAQDNLSQIKSDASNAHQYLAAHVNENADIKNADGLVQKIPPLADKTGGQVSQIQTQYDKEHNSWYARAGRFIDASFWTVVICGGIGLIVVGCVNFYTGGAITGAAGMLGKIAKLLIELPTWLIHNSVGTVAGWFSKSSTGTG